MLKAPQVRCLAEDRKIMDNLIETKMYVKTKFSEDIQYKYLEAIICSWLYFLLSCKNVVSHSFPNVLMFFLKLLYNIKNTNSFMTLYLI